MLYGGFLAVIERDVLVRRAQSKGRWIPRGMVRAGRRVERALGWALGKVGKWAWRR
ncbi:hypothetical protein JB92DRAFT_2983355 [Gautieria morchelliformis]|nr:hypothetical protein JB92DRAFT_2983355 [Gautieria morchelliformis]